MPVARGHDSHGSYYRYGKTGKKYYYKPNNVQSRKIAKIKAGKQGKATKSKKKSRK